MLLPYHRSNFSPLPNEEAFRDAVKGLDIPEDEYMVPYAGSPDVMISEYHKEKLSEGPVAMITVFPKGEMNMGQSLAIWFVYTLVVGFFCAYIASFALSSDTAYMQIMRLVGVTAFIGYSLALIQNSVWYRRKWSTTFKFMFDGLIYALLTGGCFGWLWPS
ncbi:MAG: hypothetical protein V2I33_00555 [Kangiellaceae bacterium]|jgi:hypothetical protein|nr:hypothetical protein [Kangiellaceae bacterium]